MMLCSYNVAGGELFIVWTFSTISRQGVAAAMSKIA